MFVVAIILILWYAIHAVLSRFAGTCMMGNIDRFVAGVVFGAPAAVVASWILMTRPAVATWQKTVLVVPLLFSPILLYLWVPLGISTSLAGHHLCGAQYDPYLASMPVWAAHIPFLHVALILTIVYAASQSFRQDLRPAD